LILKAASYNYSSAVGAYDAKTQDLTVQLISSSATLPDPFLGDASVQDCRRVLEIKA